LRKFYNDGFGWICRHCEREFAQPDPDEHSRLLREGEAEGKDPRLSTNALGRWMDEARETLVCPRCGATEVLTES